MGAPLDLAFFLPSMTGGGAQRIATTLSNTFVSEGHDITLYLTSAKGPFLSAVDPRVSITGLGAQHTTGTITRLCQHLHEHRPDVLVTMSLNTTVAGRGTTYLMRARGKPTPPQCAILHCLPTSKVNNASGIKERVLLQLSRVASKGVDATVAVSDAAAQDLIQFAHLEREHIRVIPNPFDIETIQEQSQLPVSHPWLRESDPVILGVGRLRPEKKFPILLHALAHLRKDRNVRLLILGDGPRRDALKTLCRELRIRTAVDFLGFVNPPYPYMAQADVLVLPSVAEAFGNVVVESLACGTPVVVTETSGGPLEIIEGLPQEYYFVVPPEAPAALADTVGDVLTQPVNEALLRSRARDFDVSTIAERYCSLFRSIAS